MKEFGLSDYEAKTYTALLALKMAKVSDIAKNCSVPRNKIYAVAESLHKKGLVEIIPEKVVRFRAVPFEEVMKILIKEQETRLRSMEESAKKISSMLSSLSVEKKREDSTGEFLVYKSRKMIRKKLRDIISRAGSKLFLAVSKEDLSHIMPIAKKASKRADVRILCSVTEESMALVKKCKSFCRIHHIEKMLPERIAIVDDSEAFVFQMNLPVALYSKDTQFVALMKSLENMIWEQSVEAEEKIREIETGVLPEEIKIVRGTDDINDITRRSSMKARKEIMRVISDDGLQNLFKHGGLEVEKEMSSKGVKVRYLLSIRKENAVLAGEMMKFAEVRHLGIIPLRVKIVDDIYCSLRQLENTQNPAQIVSTSPVFISAMRSYFEKKWANAIPAEKHIARLLMAGRVKKESVFHGVPISEFISPGKVRAGSSD